MNIMKTSSRAQKITPFYVMELLEKARAMEAQGENIVHMEVGEPNFPALRHVKESAARAISNNRTFYTHSLGIPELRERIAEEYSNSEGVSVSPDRIIITNGTSGALILLFGALLENGADLAISDPGYPCYKNMATFVNANVLSIPVTADSHYEITVDHLKSLENPPAMLVIANPSNPTGALYGEAQLASLWEYLSVQGSALIVDEIYLGLSYGEKPRTALKLSEKIIVINGFSKTHAMTGFRLGWMVVPESIVRTLQNCAQNIFISPPSISQYAALNAFDDPGAINSMRETYMLRRNYLVPRLRELGFSIPFYPEGAFYIYAGIEQWPMDSMTFVNRALEEAKVAITPGCDFGSFLAASHVRFSYADDLENLKKGCNRLERWLKRL